MQPLWSAVHSRGQWVGKFGDKRNCLRDKSTQIPQDMLGTPTWQRTTRFQLRQTLNKDIYGHLWEPGEFSLLERKPLSLIFDIRYN